MGEARRLQPPGKRTIPEEALQKLSEILQQDERVAFSYLFGSVSRKDYTPLSDIDIAVYLSKDVEHFQQDIRLDLIGKAMDVLGNRPFDLIILNSAPISLAGRIVQHRTVLSEREPFVRHAYESLTMREFWDFSRFESMVLNRRFGLGRS